MKILLGIIALVLFDGLLTIGNRLDELIELKREQLKNKQK